MVVFKFIKRFFSAACFYLGNHVIANIPSYIIRHAYLRYLIGIRLGRSSCVHMGFFITGRNISIGEHSVVNRKCFLDGRGVGLRIGNNVSISFGVHMVTMDHDINAPAFDAVPHETIIGDHVWIGCNALILPGVNIGRGAVIGAGSVVAGDVGELEVVAGNPARLLNMRSCMPEYSLRYEPFFDTDIDLKH
ncbi:acyltransferase [Fibrobacterota bacterium]